MKKIASYETDGQRLLCEAKYSASEIARLIDRPRQRISDWRSGTKPLEEDRRKLEQAINIPRSAWDKAPIRATSPAAPVVAPVAPVAAASSPAAEPLEEPAELAKVRRELDALGISGIESAIARLREMGPGLPPRERVQCVAIEGRLHDRLEILRQKKTSAREEYFASQEFREDVRVLAALIPGSSSEFRTRLARFGVTLPEPPKESSIAIEPPTSAEDVEEICAELEIAQQYREAGEERLAEAHVIALALDVHADAIARIVADDPALAGRLLGLLSGADERAIRAALERRMVTGDILAFDVGPRRKVAELLRQLGHVEIAAEIEQGGAL